MKEAPAARTAAGIDLRIATRVAALRAQAGLTLDALATTCGVSRSMMSLVEMVEISATAVVLEKIASGLGVSLATLFDDPSAPASPVSRSGERTPWRDPQSGYVRQNISPPNFPSPLQIVAGELPAGAAVSYESAARNDLHQQIWVRAGSIEVTVGKVTHRLSEDDCLAMQLNEPTSFRNRNRKTARYIVVIANEKSLKR